MARREKHQLKIFQKLNNLIPYLTILSKILKSDEITELDLNGFSDGQYEYFVDLLKNNKKIYSLKYSNSNFKEGDDLLLTNIVKILPLRSVSVSMNFKSFSLKFIQELKNLEALTLNNVYLSVDEFKIILQNNPSIIKLHLYNYNKEILSLIQNHSTLKFVKFYESLNGEEYYDAITKNKFIESLNFENYAVYRNHIEDIIKNQSLKHANISYFAISNLLFEKFFLDLLKKNQIRYLEMNPFQFTSKTCEIFSNFLKKCKSIEKLSIEFRNIHIDLTNLVLNGMKESQSLNTLICSTKNVEILIPVVNQLNITDLDLSNSILQDGIYLEKLLKENHKLTSLNLSDNQLTDDIISLIFNSLVENKSLKTLNFSKNVATNDCLKSLNDLKKNNPLNPLIDVDLSYNKIKTIIPLEDALYQLKYLNLMNCPIDQNDIKWLRYHMFFNYNILNISLSFKISNIDEEVDILEFSHRNYLISKINLKFNKLWKNMNVSFSFQ